MQKREACIQASGVATKARWESYIATAAADAATVVVVVAGGGEWELIYSCWFIMVVLRT
jgi:hypothetical protein